MANKVKYNLKNVHYAIATTGGYSTPVAMSGAVNLTLSPSGDDYVFYADGEKYFEYHSNNGYEGTLELALVPEDFRKDILGEVVTNGKVFELDDVQITNFALGFQVDGNVKETFYWFYNCSASRPDVAGQTKEESIEVNTETLTFKNAPETRFQINGKKPVKLKSADASTTTAGAWFAAVITS